MKNKNILISGAGIAGTTLAFWLKKFGFNPTIIELAPRLREGGYVIDFWGAGVDVAEKMGILPAIHESHINYQEITFVDKNNKREGGLSTLKIRRLLKNRVFNLLRSDLSKIIYNTIDKEIEVIFGNSIQSIEQNFDEVKVTFTDGTIRSFDLLIGADGLHSNVRNLLFGDESLFEKYYGYYTASFTVENYLQNHQKEGLFLNHTIPGKQVSIYSLKDNKLGVLFIFTSPQKLSYDFRDIESQKAILREEFKEVEWECPALLSKMDTVSDFYFDSVSQIQMKEWSKGRVTLVGDACACPSLLSGQGSTLAMVGAYILAGELKEANGNHIVAFEQYEKIFKPFIDEKQKIAKNLAGSFVPKSKLGIWVRNTFVNLMFLPIVSKLFVKLFLTDNLVLKECTETPPEEH